MRGHLWWIDRWQASTAFKDLTLEEQGAYRNLLDECCLREGPLPDDERVLAKLCGDVTAWPRVRERVLEHFVRDSKGWHNTTLEKLQDRLRRKARNQRAYYYRTGGSRRTSSGQMTGQMTGQVAGQTGGQVGGQKPGNLYPEKNPEAEKNSGSRAREPLPRSRKSRLDDQNGGFEGAEADQTAERNGSPKRPLDGRPF